MRSTRGEEYETHGTEGAEDAGRTKVDGSSAELRNSKGRAAIGHFRSATSALGGWTWSSAVMDPTETR